MSEARGGRVLYVPCAKRTLVRSHLAENAHTLRASR